MSRLDDKAIDFVINNVLRKGIKTYKSQEDVDIDGDTCTPDITAYRLNEIVGIIEVETEEEVNKGSLKQWKEYLKIADKLGVPLRIYIPDTKYDDAVSVIRKSNCDMSMKRRLKSCLATYSQKDFDKYIGKKGSRVKINKKIADGFVDEIVDELLNHESD
ncbi:hypothetical protein GF336_05490 [Candidatus Woesearchaeota archaeon]|nr:hypothetical protein [Candidatus Woesearchaeota archaeon]